MAASGGRSWTVVDAHPVRYVANLCFVSHHDMAAVVGAQLSALVGADTGIDGLTFICRAMALWLLPSWIPR